MMNALTCIKCKQYVSIHETYIGKKRVRIFELIHKKHPLVYVDTDEIEGYKKIDDKIDELIAQNMPA